MCYYAFGLPLALSLAFSYDYGVIGLWYGFTAASALLDLGYLFIIVCCDWHKISDRIA
jgi:Na+-driven multidrug efflux pump